METPFFTRTEADRLAQKLSHLTFIGNDGKQRKVPFKYLNDGCTYRAYVINEAISEMGFANGRIYIDSKNTSKNLRLETLYGRDTPSLQPSVTWDGYHTTSTIHVMTEASDNFLLRNKFLPDPKTELKVLDPSLSENLTGVERWTTRIGYSTYTEMSLNEYTEFKVSKQESPEDKSIVFFAPRHVLAPEGVSSLYDQLDLIGNKTRRIAKDSWNIYQEKGVAELTKHSLLEKSYELAAKFRLDLKRGATKEISDFLGSLERQPEELHEFANEFPLLLQQVRDQVSPPSIVLS